MFGLSFGTKKNKVDQTSNVNKTESTNQSQTGSNVTSGTNTSTQTGSQVNSTSGQTTTNNSTSSNTAQTGTQTQQGTTQSLSDPILSGLDTGLSQLIGKIFDPNSGDRAMLMRGVGTMGEFDVDSFVNSTVQSAIRSEGTQLGSMIRGVIDLIGGDAGENSMAALLGNQMSDDSAAKIGGVAAQARAQGEEIRTNQANAVTNAVQTSQGGLAQVIEALKGGRTNVTGTTTDQQQQTQTGNAAGTTNANETGTQTSNQTNQTTQLVTELVNMLMKGTTNTQATEHTKGTTSETGFGLGLSM